MQSQQVQKLLEAHAILNEHLERYDFENAAWVTLAIGEASKQASYYIRALNYLISATMYPEARQLKEQLQQTELNTYSPFLYSALALELQEKNEQAGREVLQLILNLNPSTAWARNALSSANPIRYTLSRCEEISAPLTACYTTSKEDRLRIHLSVHCRSCGHESNHQARDSFFNLPLVACPSCSVPYLANPQLMRDVAQSTIQYRDEPGAMGMDLLLNSWVQNWWKEEQSEATCLFDRNIFELSYFTLRYKLGEVFSSFHSKNLVNAGEASE